MEEQTKKIIQSYKNDMQDTREISLNDESHVFCVKEIVMVYIFMTEKNYAFMDSDDDFSLVT